MEIGIRPETTQDYPAIYEVNMLAFRQLGESELIEKLRKKPGYLPELSLVAEVDHTIIGHILFTPVSIRSDSKTTGSLALAPMAVLPAWQRKGIGGKLITEGLQAARKAGFSSAIVLGHPSYYSRFGFQPSVKWHIKAPFQVKEETFMAIELEEKALANAQGTVIYQEEFSG